MTDIVVTLISSSVGASVLTFFLTKKRKDKKNDADIAGIAADAAEKIASSYTTLIADMQERVGKLEEQLKNISEAERRCYDRESRLSQRVMELEKENRQLIKKVAHLENKKN